MFHAVHKVLSNCIFVITLLLEKLLYNTSLILLPVYILAHVHPTQHTCTSNYSSENTGT